MTEQSKVRVLHRYPPQSSLGGGWFPKTELTYRPPF